MNIERLRNLRIQKKASQKAIADYLGIDRTAYVKYESGNNNPSAQRLRQLAEYFNVSIDYLMGTDDSCTSAQPTPAPSPQPEVCTHYPPDIIALAEQIQGLPPSARALVEHQVKVLSDMDKK